VAEDPCAPCADHHADERDRNEGPVELKGRPAAFDECAQHSSSQINVEGIEKHAGSNQSQNPPMKAGYGKTIQARTCVDGRNFLRALAYCSRVHLGLSSS